MAIMRFNYRSQAVGGYLDITVVYPTDQLSYYDMSQGPRHHIRTAAAPRPLYKPGLKFQTIYLLHGGGDDDSLTYRYTNAERYANENNVMLVTPNIMNSFGVNTGYGVDYFTFLTEELPLVIQSLFASSPRREDNFVLGYAMGGNVALGAAVRRPDLYAACVDVSGGIGMTLDTAKLQEEMTSRHFLENFKLYTTTFPKPEDIPDSRFNVYAAAKRHKEQGDALCDFTFACGSKEFIRWRVEKDVEILGQLGYNVKYICAEGYDHDFRMWNDYIEIALDKLLPLKRRAILPGE